MIAQIITAAYLLAFMSAIASGVYFAIGSKYRARLQSYSLQQRIYTSFALHIAASTMTRGSLKWVAVALGKWASTLERETATSNTVAGWNHLYHVGEILGSSSLTILGYFTIGATAAVMISTIWHIGDESPRPETSSAPGRKIE